MGLSVNNSKLLALKSDKDDNTHCTCERWSFQEEVNYVITKRTWPTLETACGIGSHFNVQASQAQIEADQGDWRSRSKVIKPWTFKP